MAACRRGGCCWCGCPEAAKQTLVLVLVCLLQWLLWLLHDKRGCKVLLLLLLPLLLLLLLLVWKAGKGGGCVARCVVEPNGLLGNVQHFCRWK